MFFKSFGYVLITTYSTPKTKNIFSCLNNAHLDFEWQEVRDGEEGVCLCSWGFNMGQGKPLTYQG